MTRQTILAEVSAEREYQEKKWGNDTDDRLNTPMDFVGYIAHCSTGWFGGSFRPYGRATLTNFRAAMVKVAAVAVAAAEWSDRLLSGENSRDDVLQNE